MKIRIVDQRDRDKFDALVRDLTNVPTPLPPISDAVMAETLEGDVANTAGVAYIAVRHVLTPYMLVEGAPPNTLTKLCDVIADQLCATVREAVLADHGGETEVTTPRNLSYDVYVPHGQEPPEGCELLPVAVWRRRVC